jgi:hypothetical protein
MNARLIERIETNVERAASAVFAGAVGYAMYGVLGNDLPQPELGACMLVGAAIAYSLCRHALTLVAERERGFIVRAFDPREIETLPTDELVLTDADRLGRANPEPLVLTDADRLHPVEPKELVLEDVLPGVAPDARVVRLFDRKAMPSAGELQSRIDSRVARGSAPQTSADAAQALSAALAELRRSLR